MENGKIISSTSAKENITENETNINRSPKRKLEECSNEGSRGKTGRRSARKVRRIITKEEGIDEKRKLEYQKFQRAFIALAKDSPSDWKNLDIIFEDDIDGNYPLTMHRKDEQSIYLTRKGKLESFEMHCLLDVRYCFIKMSSCRPSCLMDAISRNDFEDFMEYVRLG